MLLTLDIFILKVGSCGNVQSNVHKQDVFCPFCCTSWKGSSKRSDLSKIHETSQSGWKLKFVYLWCLLCFITLTFPFCALWLHGWSAYIAIDSRYLSLNNSWINILLLKFESAAATPDPCTNCCNYQAKKKLILCLYHLLMWKSRTSQFVSLFCSLLQLRTCFNFPHFPALPTHLLSCTSFNHQPLSI